MKIKMITNDTIDILNSLNTTALRAKVAKISRDHELVGKSTNDSFAVAQILINEDITKTFQEFYARELVAFYVFAKTIFQIENPSIHMLDDFVGGKRILWNNYNKYKRYSRICMTFRYSRKIK